mmetsp:Transcript_19905/g.40661  ORF Transcript_19905/g.40661 Transcript_19905/m.40661 type:complete len:219 (+) Transcript_19905:1268-1924(+)
MDNRSHHPHQHFPAVSPTAHRLNHPSDLNPSSSSTSPPTSAPQSRSPPSLVPHSLPFPSLLPPLLLPLLLQQYLLLKLSLYQLPFLPLRHAIHAILFVFCNVFEVFEAEGFEFETSLLKVGLTPSGVVGVGIGEGEIIIFVVTVVLGLWGLDANAAASAMEVGSLEVEDVTWVSRWKRWAMALALAMALVAAWSNCCCRLTNCSCRWVWLFDGWSGCE